MPLLNNVAIKTKNLKDKGRRTKDEFERNKYKYDGMKIGEGRIGRESGGFLEITKRDIKKIYGEKKEQRNQNK